MSPSRSGSLRGQKAGRLAIGQDSGPKRGARPSRIGASPCRGTVPDGDLNESTRRGQCSFTGRVAATLTVTPVGFGCPAAEAVSALLARCRTAVLGRSCRVLPRGRDSV